MNARVIALPLIAAGIAVGIWLTLKPPGATDIPAATWRIGLAGSPSGDSATDHRQARNYDELPAETSLQLSYNCTEARYVYVFGRSTEDGTLLLFPSPELKGSLSNPVPAGQAVLPGSLDDGPLTWTTRADILATTTYIVVAAREPVPELEALLPHLRRWTNSVLPNQSLQITNPADGSKVKGKPRSPWPSAVLERAAKRSQTETLVNGPLHDDEQLPGVWSSGVWIKEARDSTKQPGGANNDGKPNIKGLPGGVTPNLPKAGMPTPGGK